MEPDSNQEPEVVEIKDDEVVAVVDLDCLEKTALEVVYEWDNMVVKRLKKFLVAESEHMLCDLMLEYLKSLQEVAELNEESIELRTRAGRHIGFLYSYYTDLQCCTTEHYFKVMEDILAVYVNIELNAVRSLKMSKKNRETNALILKSLSNRIIYTLKMYLLEAHDRILHVLIKVDCTQPTSPITNVLNKIYQHFLVIVPVMTKCDDSFCRSYILFQKWKEITPQDKWRELDDILYKKFNKKAESVKKNNVLRRILMPQGQSRVDVICHLFRSVRDIANSYFDYMAEKEVHLNFSAISLNEDEISPGEDEFDEDLMQDSDLYATFAKDTVSWEKSSSPRDVLSRLKQELDEDDDVIYMGTLPSEERPTFIFGQPSSDLLKEEELPNNPQEVTTGMKSPPKEQPGADQPMEATPEVDNNVRASVEDVVTSTPRRVETATVGIQADFEEIGDRLSTPPFEHSCVDMGVDLRQKVIETARSEVPAQAALTPESSTEDRSPHLSIGVNSDFESGENGEATEPFLHDEDFSDDCENFDSPKEIDTGQKIDVPFTETIQFNGKTLKPVVPKAFPLETFDKFQETQKDSLHSEFEDCFSGPVGGSQLKNGVPNVPGTPSSRSSSPNIVSPPYESIHDYDGVINGGINEDFTMKPVPRGCRRRITKDVSKKISKRIKKQLTINEEKNTVHEIPPKELSNKVSIVLIERMPFIKPLKKDNSKPGGCTEKKIGRKELLKDKEKNPSNDSFLYKIPDNLFIRHDETKKEIKSSSSDMPSKILIRRDYKKSHLQNKKPTGVSKSTHRKVKDKTCPPIDKIKSEKNNGSAVNLRIPPANEGHDKDLQNAGDASNGSSQEQMLRKRRSSDRVTCQHNYRCGCFNCESDIGTTKRKRGASRGHSGFTEGMQNRPTSESLKKSHSRTVDETSPSDNSTKNDLKNPNSADNNFDRLNKKNPINSTCQNNNSVNRQPSSAPPISGSEPKRDNVNNVFDRPWRITNTVQGHL